MEHHFFFEIRTNESSLFLPIFLLPIFFLYKDMCPAFVKHFCSLILAPQEMSLNIFMNRTLTVKVSGVSPKSLSRSLTLPQSCNVTNPGKMFHSNSVSSPSIRWKFHFSKIIHLFLSFHFLLDSGFRWMFHDTKSENSSVEDWWFFHHHFSWNVRSPLVPSLISQVCQIFACVRCVLFATELQLIWKFFPMNIADSIVTAMNIRQITKCSSPFFCNIEFFCLFRTWSFTRFTNNFDSTDKSDSDSSFPMMKFRGLVFSWEFISSDRPDLSRSFSSFFTDCAVSSWRIFSWPGRTFLQEVLSVRLNLSYFVISVFHSEDQARSSSNFE